MKIYEYISDFKIKYCDTDFKDEMKPSVALALMEEVACDSASELGFGYEDLKPLGMGFMVTNVYLEFLRPIKLGERIRVKTWPTPPTYAIFGREYQFLSQDGEILLNATSRWCLMDMYAGKLLQSKALQGQDYSTYNTKKLFSDIKWKIPVINVSEEEFCFEMVVKSSDYDHNMHVNNTRYADFCFNCFSVEELSRKQVKKLCICYVKQCKENEVLRFYRQKTGQGEYLIQGVKDSGERVVQASIGFEE